MSVEDARQAISRAARIRNREQRGAVRSKGVLDHLLLATNLIIDHLEALENGIEVSQDDGAQIVSEDVLLRTPEERIAAALFANRSRMVKLMGDDDGWRACCGNIAHEICEDLFA